MIFLRALAAIAVPTLLGFLLVTAVLKDKTKETLFERVFFGYGLGLGVLSMCIFLTGAFRIPYTPYSIFLPALALTLTAFAFYYYAKNEPVQTDKPPALFKWNSLTVFIAAAIILWLGFKIFFVLYEGLGRPTISQDAWFNRSAKVFFYSKGLLLDPGDEHFFGRGYRIILSYPLLNFMEQIWVSTFLGTFHESLSKAWAPFYYLSILGLAFVTVKREGGALAALVAAFFLSAAPLLAYHAHEAYADLTLSYYVFAGAILLFRHIEKGSPRYAALSGIFFGMAAFTKSEALIHLAAASITLVLCNLLEKRSWKNLLYFLLPALFYILPWIIFKATLGLGYGHGYGTGVGAADESGAIPWAERPHLEIIPVFLKEIFISPDHGLIFAFLLLVFAFAFRDAVKTKLKYLFLLIFLIVSGLFFTYAMTYDYKYVLNRMATNRNLLTAVPLALLISGLTAIRFFKKTDKEKELISGPSGDIKSVHPEENSR